MAKKNKKRSVIAMIAVLAAVVGAAVALGAFLKKKAAKLGEQLDYDGSLYYEDDDYADEDEDEPVGAAAEQERGETSDSADAAEEEW